MAEKKGSFLQFCLPYMIPLALGKNEKDISTNFQSVSRQVAKRKHALKNFSTEFLYLKETPKKKKVEKVEF